MTILSVNINKVALVRNSRGHDFPNVVQFSKDLIACGADGVTIHPRPDERHAKYQDAYDLKPVLDELGIELNIEGYPNERFLDMVCEVKPAQCTLVPDAPDAITSNAGWDCETHQEYLKEVCQRLQKEGIRASNFLDPDPKQVPFAAKTGTDRIELYTEAFADMYGTDEQQTTTQAYKTTADLATDFGLAINAGHDLDQKNLAYLVEQIPQIAEVSIGHALVVDMLYTGMDTTVKGYLNCLGR